MNFVEKRSIKNLLEMLQEKNFLIITDTMVEEMMHYYETNGKNFEENIKELKELLEKDDIKPFFELEKRNSSKEETKLVSKEKRSFTYSTNLENGFSAYLNLFVFIFVIGMSGFAFMMVMLYRIGIV